MKTLLLLVKCLLGATLLAQSLSPVADSLVFNGDRVDAYKAGTFVRYYRTGFFYPASGRENEIQGLMSYTCRFNEHCAIESLTFGNSLGVDFEKSIKGAMQGVAKVYQAYEYQNCDQIMINDTIKFDLGI